MDWSWANPSTASLNRQKQSTPPLPQETEAIEDAPSTVYSIDTHAHEWSDAQRLAVASLVTFAVSSLERQGIDTLPWKHAFLRTAFAQVGIHSRQEQEMFMLMQANGAYDDCDPRVLVEALLPQMITVFPQDSVVDNEQGREQMAYQDRPLHSFQAGENEKSEADSAVPPTLPPRPPSSHVDKKSPERSEHEHSTHSATITTIDSTAATPTPRPPPSFSAGEWMPTSPQTVSTTPTGPSPVYQLHPEYVDIRSEILNDLLYVGLGFPPSAKSLPKNSNIKSKQDPRASTLFDTSFWDPELLEEANESSRPALPPRSSTPPMIYEKSQGRRTSTSTTGSATSSITTSSPQTGGRNKAASPSQHAPQSNNVHPLEYDSRARAVLFTICRLLQVSTELFLVTEKRIAQHLYFYQQELVYRAEQEAKEIQLSKLAKEREKQERQRQKELEYYNSYNNQLKNGTANDGVAGFISKLGFRRAPPTPPQPIPPPSPTSPTISTHGEAMHNQAQSSMQTMEEKEKKWRYLATGLGVAAGATIIGLTGGLAAPLVAAGAGILLGSSAAVLGSAAGLAVMTSLFGLAGGGLAGYKVNRLFQDVKELQFVPIVKDPTMPLIPSLHLAVVISGYLFKETEVTEAWQTATDHALDGSDVYHMTFEPKELVTLGNAFKVFVATEAVRMVSAQVVAQTVFAALASALVLPLGLMRAGDLIDNPWAVAMDRARKSGVVLADILSRRVQGSRPTTLIGYSTGSIVIWECLLELAKRKEYGLIDSVVMLGTPVNTDEVAKWQAASSVVSHRFVNGYSRKDVVLGSIYRIHSMGLDVAGLRPVDCVDRIENVDLTDIISGHLEYRENLNLILSLIGTH